MHTAIQFVRRKLTYFKLNLTDAKVRDAMNEFRRTYDPPVGFLEALRDTVKNIRPFLNYVRGGRKVDPNA